jgi:hypothetical protein
VYTSADSGQVTFVSPLNPGNLVNVNGSGGYSVPLLADGNFTANVFVTTPGNASQMGFSSLPVG